MLNVKALIFAVLVILSLIGSWAFMGYESSHSDDNSSDERPKLYDRTHKQGHTYTAEDF